MINNERVAWMMTIKDDEWRLNKVVYEGFSSHELTLLKLALEPAYMLSDYDGPVKFCKGKNTKNNTEETPAAVISWFPNIFTPKITVSPEVFLQNDVENYLGITLLHELIHAKQGFWRIFWENLVWSICRKKGFPPFEEEAYNSVNIWWDKKDSVTVMQSRGE